MNFIQKIRNRQTLISQYKTTGDKSFLKAYYERKKYVEHYQTRNQKPKSTDKFKLISSIIKEQPGEGRILDIGCANQYLKKFLPESITSYIGLDLSIKFIPHVVSDAEFLPFKQKSFDWVVLSDILEHISDPLAALRSCREVSEKVIAVVPNLHQLNALSFLPSYKNDRHLHKMPPWKWRSLFREGGFNVVKTKGFYFIPSVSFLPIPPLTWVDMFIDNRWSYSLNRIIEKRLSERGIWRYIGQEFMIVGEAQKK